MISDSAKSELRNTWEKAAVGWAKWEREFSAGLSSATDTLIDMAGIRAGMRVLDLACGAGSQTIHAAKRVGPGGSVVVCDISATMLDHVRQNATGAGMQNVETLECAAEELDNTLPPFDAAISRLGLMLFPSPSSAVDGHIIRFDERHRCAYRRRIRSACFPEPDFSLGLRNFGVWALPSPPILVGLARDSAHSDFDLHPMWRVRSPSTVAGLIASAYCLRAAVLAANSANRDQTSAISSIIKRS